VRAATVPSPADRSKPGIHGSPDFDRLKAILTNCVRQGPVTQNREAHLDFRSHLQGRVAFVEMINPVRGTRLREIFQQIQWS